MRTNSGGLAVHDSAAPWANALERLPGPPLPPDAAEKRIALWRAQEWHDWFRWRLCLKGFDWSRPIWFVVLAGGLGALIAYGAATGKLFVTAGGIVVWFTVVNLGFFAYLGLRTRRPPTPLPGPFAPGLRVIARMGVYPAGYDGRTRARVWLKIPAEPSGSASANEWLVELAFPDGLPEDLAQAMRKQETFRMQRGDAPAMRALCETLAVTREAIDAGAHPLKALAWTWDEKSPEPFGLPKF
ncbi:MAG: hypothetical protein KIS92_21330 [Planctomycetota bacterium]|nr:hypothetical protein [Planctomycetota bacterium]